MAHRLARLVHRLLKHGHPYVDRGTAYYEDRYREANPDAPKGGHSARHYASDAGGFFNLVFWRDIGLDGDTTTRREFPEQVEIEGPVFVTKKHFLAIVSALRDMMRQAGQDESGWSGHADRVG